MCVYRPPPDTSLPPSLPSSRVRPWPLWPQNTGFLWKRDSGATYASIPMIGFTPDFEAVWKNSYAPNMFPWSLIATAGISCRATSANSLLFFAAPSSIEYSVCTCRWTKESGTVGCLPGQHEKRA